MLRTSYCFKGRTNERHNICKLSQCNCGNHPRQPEDIGGQPHRFISCSLIHMKTLRKRWIDSHPSFFLYSHMKAPSQLFHSNYHSPNYPGVHTFPNKQLKIEKKKKEINDVIQTKCADNLMWRISFGNDWAGGMTVSRKKRVIIWSCQGLFRTSHYRSLHWFWSIWLRCPPK